jgi:hypothetical protein
MSGPASTVYENYTYRTMGQIPKEKRPEILKYYVSHGRQAMIKKYDMSNLAAGHLLFHYKGMIEEIEDENFAKAGL